MHSTKAAHPELDQSVPRHVRATPTFFMMIGFTTLLPAVIFYPVVIAIMNKPPASGFATLVLLSMLLFFSAMLLFTLWTYFKERNLLKWGTVTEAEIFVGPEYSTGKGGRYMNVEYGFSDADGSNFSGVRRTASKYNEAASVQETWSKLKNPVAIYNPKNGEKNMLYPGVYVICLPPNKI
jgi:hypothetical protein